LRLDPGACLGACLRDSLATAGFTDIRRYPVGRSDDPALNDIEQHGRNMDSREMIEFETMVLEAAKPR
jgi:hypothetical protein